MRISVFGLGYVGAVSAACLTRDGHEVVGVDASSVKVDIVAAGRAPVIEAELDALIEAAVRDGRLSATGDAQQAIERTDLSLICVGTPSQANGALDLRYVRRVCEEIGAALAHKTRFHVVVARSTMLPGSMRQVVIPTLEQASGKVAGRDFGVCINPEFLREGTAVHDYGHPPKTVIGELDARSGTLLAELYANVHAPLVRTSIETAEMVKYTDNVWHALKVGFANEIGVLCKSQGIDSHEVMDIFCRDTKLNLSATYLKPGFAFGGSCLPKDVRALSHQARSADLELPILGAILPSNQRHVERGLALILGKPGRRVGILGFSFKAGTDDLRESPLVELIERLLGKGYELKIYDRNVHLASLLGANRDYILNRIPHIARLMQASVDAVLESVDTVVIGNAAPEFQDVPGRLRPGQCLIDLVRVGTGLRSDGERYDGICW